MFYRYVNSRCSSNNGISPLIKYDNTYASLDYDKAVLLNEQFTSVFTNDNGIIPNHTIKAENTINDILFTREMVRKCLCKLYSFITPIFKKVDTSRKENYRPIYITSIISRVFEHIQLFIHKNSFLSKHKFGFMSRKSVELQLLACLNNWTSAINDKKYIYIVYFDFKKAFDKVSQINFLIKLKDIGITSNILNWIECFLNNRKQSVKI